MQYIVSKLCSEYRFKVYLFSIVYRFSAHASQCLLIVFYSNSLMVLSLSILSSLVECALHIVFAIPLSILVRTERHLAALCVLLSFSSVSLPPMKSAQCHCRYRLPEILHQNLRPHRHLQIPSQSFPQPNLPKAAKGLLDRLCHNRR